MKAALPDHPQFLQVLDWIAQGEDASTIAPKLQPPLHRSTIWRYIRDKAKPALQGPTAVVKDLADKGLLREDITLKQATRAIATATERDLTVSPFRTRLESLWNRAENSLERAERAVRVVKDSDGQECVVGEDLRPIAPILAQAHKNLEMLGNATGELSAGSGPAIAVQIVMPSGTGAPAGDLEYQGATIDLTPE